MQGYGQGEVGKGRGKKGGNVVEIVDGERA